MGVDFYNCSSCDEIFDDCGHKYDCCEACGERICFWCQVDLGMRTKVGYLGGEVKSLGDYWEGKTLIKCPYCDGTIITDQQILNYLLRKFNTNRDDVIAEIKLIRTE